MKHRLNKTILFTLVVLLVLNPFINGFSADLKRPQQIIESVSEQLKKKFTDTSFTKNFAQATQFVHNVIDPHTDFDSFARLVLGKNWNKATVAEQERFKQEFQTLIIRTYTRAFIEYKDWTIDYMPLNLDPSTTKVIVDTKVLQPGRQAVDVSYRMSNKNGNWKVYDIIIDGVSLVINYRSSLNAEIQKLGSIQALIDKLAERNAEALRSG